VGGRGGVGVDFPFLKDFHFHDPIARGEGGGGAEIRSQKVFHCVCHIWCLSALMEILFIQLQYLYDVRVHTQR
jgi:hypothetical protein